MLHLWLQTRPHSHRGYFGRTAWQPGRFSQITHAPVFFHPSSLPSPPVFFHPSSLPSPPVSPLPPLQQTLSVEIPREAPISHQPTAVCLGTSGNSACVYIDSMYRAEPSQGVDNTCVCAFTLTLVAFTLTVWTLTDRSRAQATEKKSFTTQWQCQVGHRRLSS